MVGSGLIGAENEQFDDQSLSGEDIEFDGDGDMHNLPED